VDKINLDFYYELGARLRHIIQWETRFDSINRVDAWIAAMNIENQVRGALGGMKVSINSGVQLLTAVSTIGKWDLQHAQGDLTAEELGAMRALIWRAKAFEPIVLAELQTMPSYVVTKKGNYDSNDMVERGADVLPPEVRRKLSRHILSEVAEGSRCLVYDVPTASAFHMLRATEAVTHQFWLRVCEPASPPEKGKNLGFYIGELRGCEDADGQEVAELLNQIREKHRNDIMHPNVSLNAAEAFRLFEIAKTSIMAMAERLPDLPDEPMIQMPVVEVAEISDAEDR